MTNPSTFEKQLQRWRRPVTVTLVALLLHLLAFDWLSTRAKPPLLRPHDGQVLTIQLQAELARPQPPPPPLPVPVPPAPRKLRVPVIAAPEIVTEVTEVAGVPAMPAPVDNAPVAIATPEAVLPPPAPPLAEPVPEAPAARTFKTAPPPSAEVNYAVQALRDGRIVYGSGKIGWRRSGDNYLINGEAGVLFFTVLRFQSEGSLDAQGVAPLKYSEKRFRKAETNTHFQQAAKLISFSSSTATYPRTGGEQDRASIVWQLAAIGRGDAAQIAAGTELDIFVAGVRDAETWQIRALGEETLALGGEQLATWHFLRQPRSGSYEPRVEFWLAPSRDWYPVRLRQTETNGDYLDMTMSSITPLAER
ncbi:DUF3108 domain-containing protein [Actimicrobium sp. CCC2.4]|uniref:DUF3108 domain-containing protein n=1 Tax=Actimicrobium sp. CCC2.4 TaxID=3048606 RepID=UPI002AC96E32|nr:DUF3108 domain-containing protein [Actimicrobium sp. CCC2.4]MEB0134235.1 DUF3108 domain-containing protein [Actimicrobium sp. CCC2.4]WPX32885.1 DUF3108 domain-containing protein [Actimicrobium sp. CCC2.4]